MNLQELRSTLPPPPPPRKSGRAVVRLFEASAIVAVALLGYAVYSGMIDVPFWKSEKVSLAQERGAALAPSQAPTSRPMRPGPSAGTTNPSSIQIEPNPAAPGASGVSAGAQDFFERQHPSDQTRFAACLRMSGHEWRKVMNAVQAGLEPTTGGVATCMLSLNPGRLCEPSEVQSLVAFLTYYMQQKMAREQSTASADNAAPPSNASDEAPELRRTTIGASLNQTFLGDLRELIAQGYLKASDLGNALPAEAQVSLAGVKVERAACR